MKMGQQSVFRFEYELQEALATVDLNLTEQDDAIVFTRREVQVGGCIPDLVYVSFREVPDPYLWPSKWTYRHSFAISLLRQEGKLTIKDFAMRFFESTHERIRKILHDLTNSGATIEIEKNTFVLSDELLAVEATVVVVEAKLSRWRQAIKQAQTYKRFADQVFVAMDANFVPREHKVLASFEEAGVGLSAVSLEQFEWLVYPRKNVELGAEREYLIASAASLSRQTLWSVR